MVLKPDPKSHRKKKKGTKVETGTKNEGKNPPSEIANPNIKQDSTSITNSPGRCEDDKMTVCDNGFKADIINNIDSKTDRKSVSPKTKPINSKIMDIDIESHPTKSTPTVRRINLTKVD